MLNSQGRPTAPGSADSSARHTFTGNRALQLEEALIFETGRPDVSGVDLDEPAPFTSRLGALALTVMLAGCGGGTPAPILGGLDAGATPVVPTVTAVTPLSSATGLASTPR